MEEKQRKPWIGFAGMLLIIAGALLSCQEAGWGVAVVAVGGGVLIYALVTGHVKLFG